MRVMHETDVNELIKMARTVNVRNIRTLRFYEPDSAPEHTERMSFGTKCPADVHVRCLIECRRAVRVRRHRHIKNFSSKLEHKSYFSKSSIHKRVVDFRHNDYCFWPEEERARYEFNEKVRGKKMA
jgi:hypothetical protein